jgi:hypothetical protein
MVAEDMGSAIICPSKYLYLIAKTKFSNYFSQYHLNFVTRYNRITNFCLLSFLQNSVDFAEALAVFRPTGYKAAFFRGSSFKTEVLKEALFLRKFSKTANSL